jgi:hypothetical protein
MVMAPSVPWTGPRLRRVSRGLVKTLTWLVAVPFIAWGALALWFDASRHWWLAGPLALAFLAGCTALMVMLRPPWRALRLPTNPSP